MTYVKLNSNRADLIPQSSLGNLFRSILTTTPVCTPVGTGACVASPRAWLPPLDVYEDSERIFVTLEVPGLKKEDIVVSYQDGVLSISGEKKETLDTSKHNWLCNERYYGGFTRTVDIPVPIKSSEIIANYAEGLLHVVIPKAEEAKPQQIQVS